MKAMLRATRTLRVHSRLGQSLSTLQRAVLDCKQGDTLLVDSKIPSILIDVTSAWQEHCDIEYSKGLKLNMTGQAESCSQSDARTYSISLTKALETDSPGASIDTMCGGETPVLKIALPEMFNIALRADNTVLNMRKKIMGDVSVECNSGHVCIDQLRGEQISLQCNNADIEVKKKLEGNLSVSCHSLVAQMVHGNSVDICSKQDVSIKALYSVNSSIQSASGSVNVNLSHGHCVIKSASTCSLRGVDGSFIVNNINGGATVQVNKLYPGSESMVTSQHGQITTLVDPEVITKLYCTTLDETCINIESDGFESSSASSTSCEGVFSGQSSAVKRPISFSRKFARKSGKINIDSAELLSLRSTTKKSPDDYPSRSASPSPPSPQMLPSLSLIAKSSIVVESVSWIGNIMKKYDM